MWVHSDAHDICSLHRRGKYSFLEASKKVNLNTPLYRRIERNFIPLSPPPINVCFIYVECGYLSTKKNEAVVERHDGLYTLSLRKSKGLVQDRWDLILSSAQYSKLWGFTAGRRVCKRVNCYGAQRTEKMRLETSIYLGPLEGLVLVNVLFDSIESAKKFTPLYWFGEEVTKNPLYAEKNLAILKTLKMLREA